MKFRTFNELAAVWFDHLEKRPDLRRSSKCAYRTAADQIICRLEENANVPIQHIPHLLEPVLLSLSAGRLVHGLIALRGILAPAVGHELPTCPMRDTKLPKKPRTDREWIDPARISKFLEIASESKLGALWVLAITTGMRQGEMLALQWGDIDFELNLIHVRRKVYQVDGIFDVGPPKSRAGRRTFCMPGLTKQALADHFRLRAKQAWGTGPEDLLFTTRDGNYYSRSEIGLRFKMLLRKAGMNPKLRFHDLRHSAATLLLSLGESPKVVQHILGHSTIATTLDQYGHVTPMQSAQAAAKIDGFLTGQKPSQHDQAQKESGRRSA